MTPDRLIYLFDPLCGWCYGAGPGLARLSGTGVALDLLPTGLFAGAGGREMDADFARYAWSNDQRIGQMTGVAFTDSYRRDVLEAGGRFDSALATLAIVAAGTPGSAERRRALAALQLGRYVEGRSLTLASSVAELLAAAGLPDAAAQVTHVSDGLFDRANAEIAQGQSLLRQLGARGVPTLAALHGETLSPLNSEVLFDPKADLSAALGLDAPV